MIYFISDLHFGHEGILRLERDQFKTIEEHDEYIIEKINKQVKITDELWILGDVGDPKQLMRVNGKKYIILGNHDKRSMKEYEAVASKVYKHPVYYNKRVLLSHHPHPVPSCTLNVHGHLHGAVLDSPNHVNLSIDVRGYKMFSEKDIQNIVSNLPKENRKFLQEWYADLYKFTVPKDDVITDKYGRIDLEMTKLMRKRGL